MEVRHIFADTHMVNGKMEAFQPILATKVSMPTQTTWLRNAQQSVRELGRLRNANVAIGMIGANWLYRLHCSIVGVDLTARDVVAQVVHQFSTDTGSVPESRVRSSESHGRSSTTSGRRNIF